MCVYDCVQLYRLLAPSFESTIISIQRDDIGENILACEENSLHRVSYVIFFSVKDEGDLGEENEFE